MCAKKNTEIIFFCALLLYFWSHLLSSSLRNCCVLWSDPWKTKTATFLTKECLGHPSAEHHRSASLTLAEQVKASNSGGFGSENNRNSFGSFQRAWTFEKRKAFPFLFCHFVCLRETKPSQDRYSSIRFRIAAATSVPIARTESSKSLRFAQLNKLRNSENTLRNGSVPRSSYDLRRGAECSTSANLTFIKKDNPEGRLRPIEAVFLLFLLRSQLRNAIVPHTSPLGDTEMPMQLCMRNGAGPRTLLKGTLPAEPIRSATSYRERTDLFLLNRAVPQDHPAHVPSAAEVDGTVPAEPIGFAKSPCGMLEGNANAAAGTFHAARSPSAT